MSQQPPPMKLPNEIPQEALDPLTDPSVNETAQQIIAAANSGDVEAPTLPRPNTAALHVDLPVGLRNPLTGQEIKEAEVRELTGEDEEYFQRGKHFQDRKARIIERATVSLDGEEPDKATLSALSTGDREALLLAISRATYGDELPLPTLTCPRCKDQHDVIVDLSEDIEVRTQDGPIEQFTFRDGGVVKFHWPTGDDERIIWDYGTSHNNATTGELNTQMLARVVEEVDSEPWFGERSAKAMGLARRSELVKYIGENSPGPQYDKIPHECPSCGYEDNLEVAFEDLFR